LWTQTVSDVTGLRQEVHRGPSRAGVGAALLAAVAVSAAALESAWPQPTVRVEPHLETTPLYDELYGWFRELADATRPQVHALGLWQRDGTRGTMSPDREQGMSVGYERRGSS
jgi:sugar (pentulose or hexulose) kinase